MLYWRLLWFCAMVMPALTGCAFETPSQPAAAAQARVATTSLVPPATCPVTSPPEELFAPPLPYPRYPPSSSDFWYGTAELWTAVPNGVWSALPHNPEGYTQKVFWWNKDYVWKKEPQPQLTVTGRRLDASAGPLKVSRATHAFADDIQSAMLVGVDFPTLGCWEITGRYRQAELSFVVWVTP